jgi:hypothetical protein
MSAYSKVKTALTPLGISLNLITCNVSPKPDDYIVYSQIDAPNKTAADGKVTGVSYRIQVDYMTKKQGNIVPIGEKIETLMLEAGFMRVGDSRDSYDSQSSYYYRQQDFRLYERR